MIELHINADDLRQVPHFLGLQKHDIERAMLRAINKTARWLRTRIAREVATELNVKVGLARSSLQLRMASRHGLNASVGLNPKASRIKAGTLHWRCSDKGKPIELLPKHRYRVNNATMIQKAVVKGLGVSILPRSIGDPLVVNGKLISLLDEYIPFKGEMFAVYPSRQNIPARITAFIDYLTQRLSH